MATEAITATLVLGGMCLLMWWLARLARKRMGVGAGTVSSAGLRVVGKRALGQKTSLFVVEIAGGRHILLGASIDGSVRKLDDISPEEYAVMSADEPTQARPKLRVARPSTDAAQKDELARAIDGADETGDSGEGEGEGEAQPQFASVGESFTHLLGRAKEARTTRRDRRASGE